MGIGRGRGGQTGPHGSDDDGACPWPSHGTSGAGTRLTPNGLAASWPSRTFDRGDLVLDIGAGTGTLTAELVAAGAYVIAIELHPERLAHLRARFGSDGARGARRCQRPAAAASTVPGGRQPAVRRDQRAAVAARASGQPTGACRSGGAGPRRPTVGRTARSCRAADGSRSIDPQRRPSGAASRVPSSRHTSTRACWSSNAAAERLPHDLLDAEHGGRSGRG